MFLWFQFVLKDVILMNSAQCPVCLETKAAAIQTAFSAVFPMLLAPIGCASVSSKLVHIYALNICPTTYTLLFLDRN